jgi:hypothetical protein
MNTNLIGISGKIGSGKDTVAHIIQYLTLDPEVFSMKDEDILADLEHKSYVASKSRYKIKKFAGKLKTMASLLTGIPVEKFEDQEFKKEELGIEWSYPYPGEYYDDGQPVMVRMSVRQLLQKLGTEAMREGLHTNVWVNALMADYHPIKLSQDNPSYWLVTDTRFPNEAEAIKERGGLLLRIERPGAATGTHASETALDDYPFEYVIVNDGDLHDLIRKVKKLMIDLNIIP